eukprot:4223210-Pyramimonas_sp.AAC.1
MECVLQQLENFQKIIASLGQEDVRNQWESQYAGLVDSIKGALPTRAGPSGSCANGEAHRGEDAHAVHQAVPGLMEFEDDDL